MLLLTDLVSQCTVQPIRMAWTEVPSKNLAWTFLHDPVKFLGTCSHDIKFRWGKKAQVKKKNLLQPRTSIKRYCFVESLTHARNVFPQFSGVQFASIHFIVRSHSGTDWHKWVTLFWGHWNICFHGSRFRFWCQIYHARMFRGCQGQFEANMLTKNLHVSIKTWLCLEILQIWGHLYFTNAPHLYSKSGLGFAISQSITKFLYRVSQG